MTNEALNAACSEFVGWGPSYVRVRQSDGKVVYQGEPNQSLEWYKKQKLLSIEYAWEPVSTDWAAAGRLMDAMRTKGYCAFMGANPHGTPSTSKRWFATICFDSDGMSNYSDDSGPMALALAVAELARASKPANEPAP